MPELIPLILALAMLVRICWTDFTALKIYNRDLLVLLSAVVIYLVIARPDDLLLRFGLAAILFAVAFAFWLLGKAGAGDAKLLGIAGILIPPSSALVFAVLLLAFALGFHLVCAKAELVRFLPAMAGRRFTELMAARRLPYGVPIALATVAVVSLQLASGL